MSNNSFRQQTYQGVAIHWHAVYESTSVALSPTKPLSGLKLHSRKIGETNAIIEP